ncbi:MAG TPA: response regulator [Novosphingobium sp.]|nr:response regulator [Novosphingobium sp.]
MPPLARPLAPPEPVKDDFATTARILVVDDDERNLLALSQALREVGEVVTAGSGREALRHLLQGEFAVVLLDVFMPEMDGYEVAELIRERRQTAHIPIIFLSAVNKETEHLMRGYAMGAVDYVFKPVDPVVLTSKVGVFVDLFDMRKRIEAKNRAELELREASFRAQLERLQIENELNATRARQASVLEALPLALFEAVADNTGMLVRRFVAGDLARLAGTDAPAIESGELCWEERIHPEDRAGLGLPGAAQDAFSAEYRWRCADGAHKHFIERAVPISCDAGGLTLWAGTLFDVTERKQLEAQLVQAGKMDALGQLTGGVAHDFNNVLAAVLGGARLLERRAVLDERHRRVVEQMRVAAERGADLVRRMMAFARRQELTPVFLVPTAVCEEVAGLVEQTLGGQVALEWTCAPTELVFHADRSQLELALVNLIINARDAMPEGGTIRLAIAEVAGCAAGGDDGPGAPSLRIEVTDTGSGMPPEVLERITEPFFTTKGVGRGTGLGLSMVTGFIQQSGGSLAIESVVGKGTTVRITMPAARQSHGDAEHPAEPEPEEEKAEVRHVMVVDDDPSVRAIVAELLRELGVSVHEAASGFEAVAALSAAPEPIELLLTDYAMPGLNGLQTIRQARALRPALRCALMTGNADDRLEALIPPATRLLRKPLNPRDLAALLRATVGTA